MVLFWVKKELIGFSFFEDKIWCVSLHQAKGMTEGVVI
jgi:hypothetical protein